MEDHLHPAHSCDFVYCVNLWKDILGTASTFKVVGPVDSPLPILHDVAVIFIVVVLGSTLNATAGILLLVTIAFDLCLLTIRVIGRDIFLRLEE
jgi:hypothetical protein